MQVMLLIYSTYPSVSIHAGNVTNAMAVHFITEGLFQAKVVFVRVLFLSRASSCAPRFD